MVKKSSAQQQGRVKRTERAVSTAGRNARGEQCLKERSWAEDENKDFESHQHVATEQRLKVAKEAGEHQIENTKLRLKLRNGKLPSCAGDFVKSSNTKRTRRRKDVTQKQREVQQTVTDR